MTRREGTDLTLVGVGIGVHRALEAADRLAAEQSVEAGIIDLRSVQSIDQEEVLDAVRSRDCRPLRPGRGQRYATLRSPSPNRYWKRRGQFGLKVSHHCVGMEGI